jgi:hypothetical protein
LINFKLFEFNKNLQQFGMPAPSPRCPWAMQHRYGFEAVERLFIDLKQDPNEPRKLFGGVPFLVGGDFAQTLPVVKRAPRSGITAACLIVRFSGGILLSYG